MVASTSTIQSLAKIIWDHVPPAKWGVVASELREVAGNKSATQTLQKVADVVEAAHRRNKKP